MKNTIQSLVVAATLLGVSSLTAQELFNQGFFTPDSVSLAMGQEASGNRLVGQGLAHAHLERDGLTTLTNVQGVACRLMNSHRHPKSYAYFSIDPQFKQQHDLSRVTIEVEYFDGFQGQLGVFGVQYDSKGAEDGLGSAYQQTYPSVPLRGSEQWKKATFRLYRATFQNSQNAKSDFRLWASPPELFVRRVTVAIDRSPPGPFHPLAFNAAGEAAFTDWNVQWDSGSRPSFATSQSAEPGSRWLEIHAPGNLSLGSWRTSMLLEPGAYEFVGFVRTEGTEPGSGASLRVSFAKDARAISTDGNMLAYDFTIDHLQYVELVCELLAAQGKAFFAADSLKLIRKGGPAQ
jgi:hypothetical protein